SMITIRPNARSSRPSFHWRPSILPRLSSSQRSRARASIHSSGERRTARSRLSSRLASVVLPAPGRPHTMTSLGPAPVPCMRLRRLSRDPRPPRVVEARAEVPQRAGAEGGVGALFRAAGGGGGGVDGDPADAEGLRAAHVAAGGGTQADARRALVVVAEL